MPFVRMQVATGITGLGAVTAGQVVEVDEPTAAHLERQALAERVSDPTAQPASPGRDADSDVDAEQMTHPAGPPSAEDDEPEDGEDEPTIEEAALDAAEERERETPQPVPGISRAQAGPLMKEGVQPGRPITAPRPRGRPRKGT